MADPRGLPHARPRGRRAAAGRGADPRLERGLPRWRRPRPAADHQDPGRPLHGLRHPVLPPGLPARQPHPRVERPGLARRLGRARWSGCTPPTTSRSSPAGCARRRARRRACSGSTRTRSRSRTSRSRSSTAPGTSGYVRPQPPEWLSGKTVAVVGSGPAGLAAAQQLTRAGHTVAVYERADKIGGLLRYGIPEFKMEKARPRPTARPDAARGHGLPRRRRRRGRTSPAEQLKDRYDAIVLAVGATLPRDLPVTGPRARRHPPGDGVPAAVQPGRARRRGRPTRSPPRASTSSSSAAATPVPTASARPPARARASITQLEIMPEPPGDAARRPAVADVPDDLPRLLGPRGGRRPGLRRVDAGVPRRRVRPGARRCGWSTWSSRAAGPSRCRAPSGRSRPTWCCWRWASPDRRQRGLVEQLGCRARRARQRRAATTTYASSVDGVFVAGDCGRGQSLIVWAIAEGRAAAAAVDALPDRLHGAAGPDPADGPSARGVTAVLDRSKVR